MSHWFKWLSSDPDQPLKDIRGSKWLAFGALAVSIGPNVLARLEGRDRWEPSELGNTAVATLLQSKVQDTDLSSKVRAIAEALAKEGVEVDLDGISIVTESSFSPEEITEAIYSPEALEALGFMKSAFRHLEPAKDRHATRTEIAGYYRLSERELVILSLGERADLTIAHELVHVWQHQVHRLDDRTNAVRGTLEEASILLCLAEGQATLLTERIADCLAPSFHISLTWNLDNAEHDWGAATRLLPYAVGRTFLIGTYLEQDWGAVQGALDVSVPSTEQMIHHLKRGIDVPVEVTLPTLPPEIGVERAGPALVAGEFTLRSLLLQATEDTHASFLASTGWDGDRFQMLELENGTVAAWWRIVWDRERDAQQFAEAAERLMSGQYRQSGRAFDWASADSLTTQITLLKALSSHPLPEPQDEKDEVTTGIIEEDWILPLHDSIFARYDRQEETKDD